MPDHTDFAGAGHPSIVAHRPGHFSEAVAMADMSSWLVMWYISTVSVCCTGISFLVPAAAELSAADMQACQLPRCVDYTSNGISTASQSTVHVTKPSSAKRMPMLHSEQLRAKSDSATQAAKYVICSYEVLLRYKRL